MKLYNHLFKNWDDCKQIILEMDSMRRNKIEDAKVWDDIIDWLYYLDSTDYADHVKIKKS